MEPKSVYYLVCLKKDKKYILRDKEGNDHKLSEQFHLRKVEFFQRTRDTLYIKCGSTLYQIDITERDDDNRFEKEKTENVLFSGHKGMLFAFDGKTLSHLYNSSWRDNILSQQLNDVTLFYSAKRCLIAFGSNVEEEPRILIMKLEEQSANPAKRLKRSDSFESIKYVSKDEDESSLKIFCNYYKINRNEKVIAFQYFEEQDRLYLFYILLNEKTKDYQVYLFPHRRIRFSRTPTSLLGFVYFSRTLYVYGIERGSLLFYKYNCNHKFELVRERDNPKFFQRDEANGVFRILLSEREVKLLKQETFCELKMPKTFSLDEVEKKLIVTGKRNAGRSPPNYCELTDSDDEYSKQESESYYDSDQVEYLSSSKEEEDKEKRQQRKKKIKRKKQSSSEPCVCVNE